MNIILRAAMVAVSLGTIGPAYADRGVGRVGDSGITEVTGAIAQAPAPSVPSVEAAQKGQLRPSNRAAWIFPPIGKYLVQ